MLVDIGSSSDASVVATRLLEAVAQPMQHRGREALITASAGISVSPRDADNVLDLTQKAEQALYAAKAAGRATHRFFDEQMNVVAGRKLALGSDLRRAIGAGELRLFLQPKVDANDGTMVGAEALVRWQHPQRGLLSPYEFIPLAEELGLIVPLGDWVLQTACEALQDWQCAGIATVPLSINLSSISFMQPGMVEQLEKIVRDFGVEPRQIILEVTESVLMNDTEVAIARMQTLSDSGFELSLDDFGTGFSSLSYLKMFPIDELKIDRAFVRDVTEDERDAALVGSIIALGQQFRVRVVAEGVENAAQAAFLIDRGCHIQQGYLFARPMPLDDFQGILSRGVTLKPPQQQSPGRGELVPDVLTSQS
jgi:EAL domain-containing protein (putative c-di-GMP-specific phosphodiesterase class I)